jgi:hypothetical protein
VDRLSAGSAPTHIQVTLAGFAHELGRSRNGFTSEGGNDADQQPAKAQSKGAPERGPQKSAGKPDSVTLSHLTSLRHQMPQPKRDADQDGPKGEFRRENHSSILI